MATRLDIWNRALSRLGEDPIEFEDEEAQAAFASGTIDPLDDNQRRCSDVYPDVVETLLAAHPWSWLARRNRLQEAPVVPPETDADWPFIYRYHNPEPLVSNIRAVYDRNDSHALARVDGWLPMGDYIFADFSPGWIVDQGVLTETRWPKLFVTAAVLSMCEHLAMPVKEDVPTMNVFARLAENALVNAQRVDSQSHPSEGIQWFDWEEARLSGRSNLQGRV